MPQPDYRRTVTACFIGYIVQAIVNNFVPLLFVMFQQSYAVSLSGITALITVNFMIQLTVDLLSAWVVDRIGYRACTFIAHSLSALGLVLLTILPECFPDPFVGILLSVAVYAVGGGLLEVIVSPIVDACPSENKEKAMSLLHSFYCWGHVAVVLLSTAFFALAGVARWKLLALLWAAVPLCNLFLFAHSPFPPLAADPTAKEQGSGMKKLFSDGRFWLFLLMMLCAGASEQAVSQWASAFAEKGLGVSKTIGDLAGPMAFAVLMGFSRLLFGKYGDRWNLDRFMWGSCLLCIASYLCIVFVPSPVVGLVGCAICGFSVGIMWPGTYSRASASLGGSTAVFALLALAGDLGCAAGPALAGAVSGALGGDLHKGILAAVVFPVVMTLCLLVFRRVTTAARMSASPCDPADTSQRSDQTDENNK